MQHTYPIPLAAVPLSSVLSDAVADVERDGDGSGVILMVDYHNDKYQVVLKSGAASVGVDIADQVFPCLARPVLVQILTTRSFAMSIMPAGNP
mmetsp:Transcript_11610/g.25449  ORF Transcript_11610/g.25449 Transcript_11610/m.25449 type:complete len:93 (-) Transcript_11610:25-303(-)